jgi:hypothetical protein
LGPLEHDKSGAFQKAVEYCLAEAFEGRRIPLLWAFQEVSKNRRFKEWKSQLKLDYWDNKDTN